MDDFTKKRKSRTKSTDVVNQKKYQCHCGRKYLSYSALYIHSKQKHGVTITTKNFQARNQGSAPASRVNGSYPPNSQTNFQNFDNYTQQNQNIERVICRYINKWKPNQEKVNFMEYTLSNLVVCINSNSYLLEDYTAMANYTQKRSPALIPLIFNFFLVDFCPKSIGTIYEPMKQNVKQAIYDFGQWLFENSLTYYEIKLNQPQIIQ